MADEQQDQWGELRDLFTGAERDPVKEPPTLEQRYEQLVHELDDLLTEERAAREALEARVEALEARTQRPLRAPRQS
jgi:hypothetical protein